eukprot:m.225960 g.225960  ORF g.225960 m.225960 type:complete len:66 (-) comp15656_c0_seq3:3106-3303(-)
MKRSAWRKVAATTTQSLSPTIVLRNRDHPGHLFSHVSNHIPNSASFLKSLVQFGDNQSHRAHPLK